MKKAEASLGHNSDACFVSWCLRLPLKKT